MTFLDKAAKRSAARQIAERATIKSIGSIAMSPYQEKMKSLRAGSIVERKTAFAALAPYGVGSLLASPIANPKLAKGLVHGVMTAPMHLAPASLSGHNVCPKATAGCIAACLHTAGNPMYMAGKSRARVAKTKAYFGAREAFMTTLAHEVASLERKAKRANMIAGIRLNATSDIPWERVPVTYQGQRYVSLMAAFPSVTFYDYTKRANRKNLPPNYSLTFSLAENNDLDAIAALHNGMNVAVVFDTPRGKPLPDWMAYSAAGTLTVGTTGREVVGVIDGDEHDFRPFDPKGVIVGLRAKGKAKDDKAGFVRSAI